ncbi:MAG: sodium-dependent bicarbonate transport family permease [Pseudomonadota bacterium]
MEAIIALAAANLLSPNVLFFALGFAAAMARSDLSIPEAVAKGMSIYLLMAIGFKGGAGVAENGLTFQLGLALVAGAALSAAIPLIAFFLLRAISKLSVTDAAAVAAHYGSISIVTFVAMTSMLDTAGVEFEGFMVAVAAIMEAPAILTALFLVSGAKSGGAAQSRGKMDPELMREVMLNSSIVLLIGAFAIGWITGTEGLAKIEAFIVSPFQGVLCLFLLDMGLIAGRGMRDSRKYLAPPVILFGVMMPLIGAVLGLAVGNLIGLSVGGVAILMTLCASASYIAVPAAMRVALPEANPSIYLTLSLGVTFPFNLTVGISLYLALSQLVGG